MNMHGSVVAFEGRGLLIIGPSGSGKSTLALALMAIGADLVADDRVDLAVCGGQVIASAPPSIKHRIEARGVGILNARALDCAPLALVVDLGAQECDRLPADRKLDVAGVALPLVLGPMRPHLEALLKQVLLYGRSD